MTTKHSQPQSTLAKSLTSTSTNTPYFKAAGTVLHCFFCFSSMSLFPQCLEFCSKVLELYISEACTCFYSGKRHYSITHYELLFNDLNN